MTERPPTRRVGPAAALRQAACLAGRGILLLRKSPEQLVDVTFQPVLLLVAFGYLFGGAMAGSPEAYLRLLVPGLLVLSAVMASVATGVGLNTDVTTGVFDRFRGMPIARSAPLLGAVLADLVRYVVMLVSVLATGLAMGFRPHAQPLSVLAAALLVVGTGACFCWITVFVGMLVDHPDAVRGIAVTFVLPLSFASDVFAPAATMPGWLREWCRINPVSLLTNALRGLLDGGPVAAPLLGGVAWLAGIVAVFVPLAMAAYRRRVG
jgi:oleandomycin transport system permease protein